MGGTGIHSTEGGGCFIWEEMLHSSHGTGTKKKWMSTDKVPDGGFVGRKHLSVGFRLLCKVGTDHLLRVGGQGKLQ